MSTPGTPTAGQAAPAGWYEDGSGRLRWFDGTQWTEQFQSAPVQPTNSMGPMTSSKLNVKREVVYNRQQTGHSLTKHICLGIFVLWIPTIYYSLSPNHYWHA